MIDSDTLREAAANIDWSTRHLRLGVEDLPDGSTREIIRIAIIKIDAVVDALFREADTLERWPEDA